MIEREHRLPLSRQSQILELSRSSLYYKAMPVKAQDLQIMKQIDEIHLKYPFWGSRNIRDELREQGYKIGRGHVSALMKKMGIEAIYRKPRLSKPHSGHKVYPYLLKGMEITRANQVWATRKVLTWRVSNTLDVTFCTDALEEAIMRFGVPDIFNTDQGSQFTSEAFTELLKAHGIRISMDGRGRWLDNVFVERLWRSLKYEDVYIEGI